MSKREVLRKMYGPAVANGIKYLDEKYPGWLEKVDTDKLDMGFPQLCICGQVGVVEGEMDMSGKHGFFANDNCFDDAFEVNGIKKYSDQNKKVLKSIWVERINRRRRYHKTERPQNILKSLCRTYVVGV